MSDDLTRIADALTRIADVADLKPPRDENTYHQRSVWEELAGVLMFELPRIGYALSVLADTDPKTLLKRAAAQAEALLEHVDLHLPEPKPEPKPQRPPAQVLEAAWSQTEDGSVEEAIMEAAWRYAVDHPEWFDTDLIDAPVDMLESTAEYVFNREPEFYAILAAYHVAKAHPEWFGGEV